MLSPDTIDKIDNRILFVCDRHYCRCKMRIFMCIYYIYYVYS